MPVGVEFRMHAANNSEECLERLLLEGVQGSESEMSREDRKAVREEALPGLDAFRCPATSVLAPGLPTRSRPSRPRG